MYRIGIALAALAITAAADVEVENPEYVAWAKFKKGASVTTKQVSNFEGIDEEVTTTKTLVEVGPDKVTWDVSTAIKRNGKVVTETPPQKSVATQTVKLPGAKPGAKLYGPATKPQGTYEEGTETLKIGGTEVKTTWYKSRSEAGGNTIETKLWVSDEVPGHLVRSETSIAGPPPKSGRTEVIEFKKP